MLPSSDRDRNPITDEATFTTYRRIIMVDLQLQNYETMKQLTEEQIKDGVENYINWLQSAVYDMVAVDEDFNHRGYGSERDCAADDAYDNPDILRSLIGDYIPLQQGSYETFVVLYYFYELGHKAIKEAVLSMSYLIKEKK